MNLTSLGDLKSFMQKKDSNDDNLLKLIVELVSAQIETFLNRDLESASRTVKLDGGNKRYYMRAYPINLSPAPVVKIDTTTQVDENDYWIHPEEGYIEFYFKVSTVRPRILEITYTGGYTSSNKVLNVPTSIKMAAMTQAAHMFMRRDTLGVTSMSMPDGSISSKGAIKLLPIVEDLIQAYRNPGSSH